MLTLAHDSTVPNPRRGWATLTSFAAQTVALAMLLVIPLLRPGLLPRLDLTPHLVSISLPHMEAPAAQRASSSPATTLNPTIYTVPPEVPRHTDFGPDTTPTETEAPCPQCIGIAKAGPAIPADIPIIGIAVPPPLPKPANPLRVSRMMDGLLIHRVQPDYPNLAKQSRVQGPVEIAALISRQGTIENLQVVSGHPMLIRAALDAVKQWRYRPYLLNGEPIEVDTKITVIFSLGGN